MLRTNLASRPFYNDRAVRIGIGGLAVLVAALTAFNAFEVLALNGRNNEMTARVAAAEDLTAQYREKARAVAAEVDQAEITAMQDAAREANLLIARRAFSWTELFNRFESTLPGNVRITAVEPQFDREGRLLVAASVVSRRIEDLNVFMDQLESRGGFRDVISRQDDLLQDGTMRSIVQGYYTPTAGVVEAPADAGANAGPGNASASGPGPSGTAPRGVAP